jgi:hypothetical protein
MSKIVVEVVASLKKLPEPGKKTGSFWDFMKGQLLEEGTWEKSHLSIIENEIDGHLSRLDPQELTDLWKKTDAGSDKFDSDKKVDPKEMKSDLSDELMGQVMDRMDDNYSSRDSFYPSQTYYEPIEKKEAEEEIFEDESEPEKIEDEELNLNDDDLFDEESFDEEDEAHF